MALEKQKITLNLSQGADQKTDPKSLRPGTPTKVENAQFTKANRLDKRFGYDALSPDIFYTAYDFSSENLSTTNRILQTGSGSATVSLDVIFEESAFPPASEWAAQVRSELSGRGYLEFTGLTGIVWTIQGIGISVTVSEITFGNYIVVSIAFRTSSTDKVRITKDNVLSSPVEFYADFLPWDVDDYFAWQSANPNGWQNNQGIPEGPLRGIVGTENHLLLHAGDKVYSYSKVRDEFRSVGNHITAETEIISPDETSRPMQGCDCIHVNGVTYYGMLEMLINSGSITSAYVWVMAIDEASGEVLFTPQQCTVNEDTTMKLFEFNGQAYIFYSYKPVSGGSPFLARKINPTGIGPEVILFNDLVTGVPRVAGNFWDVMNLNDTWMVFGYPDNDNFGNDAVRFFDGDFVEGTGNFAKKSISSSFHGEGVVLSMSSSGTKFFFVGSEDTVEFLRYIIFNADGTGTPVSVLFSIKAIKLYDLIASGGSMVPKEYNGKHGVNILMSSNMLAYDTGWGVNRGHIAEDGTITTDVAGYKPLFDVRIISKAWIHDGKEFYVFYRNAPNDTCYFFGTIIDPIGVDATGVASIHVTSQILYGRVPDENSDFEIRLVQRNITEISPGVARFAVLAKDSITSMPGCVSAKMDFNSKELFSGIPYGNSVILAGNNLHSFGGQYLRELNFWYAARAPILDRTPTGGEITDGSHSVVVVYEFQDKNGYLHRSRPGPETTIVIADGNNGTLTVQVACYHNSNMDEEGRYLVKIIPYRTVATGGGGSIYYRDDYFEKWDGGGATPYIHNNGNLETITITLRRSDAELSTKEVLYTMSGEKPPTPIPPVKYLASWGSRIWAGGSARDEAIYYSKLNQTNLMPEFTELFSTAIQDKPGRTTGLIGLSDKIIMSKRGRLFYSFGGGPNNLGINGSFSNFEEIPGIGGAVNGKSMVVNRSGLNYKSDKGIYTLTPGLQTNFSGASYEDEADTDIIKSIAPIDSETIRFITATGIIAYDNFFNAWSKDSSGKLVPIDACIHGSQFYVLSATDLLRENRSKWIDGATSYDMSVETGWISLAGITGFQRFYKMIIVMDNVTPYTVTVSLAYDYGDYVDSTTFTDTTDSRIIIYPTKQKCTAFRFKIEVAPNGGTEQSLNINSVGIVAGLKKGLPKLQVSQRIGVTTI